MTTTASQPRWGTRQVGALIAGTGAAQAISLAALPLLTRLYGPENLGVLAFFGSVALLTGLVVCGRYELAIPIPTGDEEARDLLRLATTVGLVGTLVLSAVVLIAVRSPVFLPQGSTPGFLVWLPVSLVLTSLYQPLSYWFTRKQRFRALAWTRISQSGTAAAVQVGLGLSAYAIPNALIVGVLAGQAVATLTLEAAARAGERVSSQGRFGLAGLRSVAHRYRDFPRFTTGSGLLQLASDHLPLILVPILFGMSVAGTYALSARLMQAAIVLLATTTAQAFYPHAVREHRAGALAETCVRLHRSLLRWTLAPILLVSLVAPDLFGSIFGPDWTASGRYFRALVPWFLTAAPLVSLSQVFLVLGKQRQALLFQAALVAVVLGTLMASARILPPERAILALATAGGIVRLAAIDWLLRAAGAPRGAGIRVTLSELARTLPFLALPLFARVVGAPPSLSLGLAAVLGGIHVTVQARTLVRRERTG